MMNQSQVLGIVVGAVVECGQKGGRVFLTEEGIKTFHKMVKNSKGSSDLPRFFKINENVG